MATGGDDWDPFCAGDTGLSKESRERIQKVDMKRFFEEKSLEPYIYVYFDEDDMAKVHVLAVGERCTPYYGGFFYFVVRFPHNYPQDPPKVKLMNTGGGRVRFNPNIYINGKVCHPILGTWSEKSWKPENQLFDVLLEIQAMLNERPFENEPDPFHPGFPFPELPGNDMSKYNDVIRHETLRVAVCDMLEPGTVVMPEEMRTKIKDIFFDNYKDYIGICKKNNHLNDIKLDDHDPFGHITVKMGLADHVWNFNSHPRDGNFDYHSIQERIQKIKQEVDKERERSVLNDWLP
ncbi:ubiquitin-conjugating enzyme E2 Z-like [Liolophura sinensis]|uniref:ubiquitin-conjugating enzyme E2 Z-like n=1 Tax=Liolophura sinensis TaxID=3198878 RepID=UPI0031586F90